MKKAWDRKPKESDKNFSDFVVYRDWPYENGGEKRSLAKVGQKVGKSKTYLETLSSKYEWIKRVLAYDDHMDQKNQNALVRQQIEARKRHAMLGSNLQVAAAQALEARRKDVEMGDVEFHAIVRMLKEGVGIERLALDMANFKIDTSDEGQNIPQGVIILPAEDLESEEDIVIRKKNNE